MEDTKPRHPTRSLNLVPSTSRLGPCTLACFPCETGPRCSRNILSLEQLEHFSADFPLGERCHLFSRVFDFSINVALNRREQREDFDVSRWLISVTHVNPTCVLYAWGMRAPCENPTAAFLLINRRSCARSTSFPRWLKNSYRVTRRAEFLRKSLT